MQIDGKTCNAGSPTYIGCMGKRRFYEHPVYGDESPMIERVGKDSFVTTDFWDLEDVLDALQPLF